MSIHTKANENAKKSRREKGSGCLIPPRHGVTGYWAAKVLDKNHREVRRSTKVRGGLKKAGLDPRDPENWTNITAAKLSLKNLVKETEAGNVAVGSDPSQLHYADLRKLYMDDYTEQNRKSLMRSAETDEAYVCGLKWLYTA